MVDPFAHEPPETPREGDHRKLTANKPTGRAGGGPGEQGAGQTVGQQGSHQGGYEGKQGGSSGGGAIGTEGGTERDQKPEAARQKEDKGSQGNKGQ